MLRVLQVRPQCHVQHITIPMTAISRPCCCWSGALNPGLPCTKAQDGLFHYQINTNYSTTACIFSEYPTVHQIWDSANSGWHTTVLCNTTLPIRLQNTINWKVCHNSEMLKCACMYTDLHTHIYLRLTKYSNPIAWEQAIPKKVL